MAAPTSRVRLGEYPVMIQYGYAESAGRFDHWGAGHVHTFPNEGTANGTVVIAPGDIVVLPYCRYVQDEVRLEIRDGFIRKIEGGLDAKLMSDWLEGNRRKPDDMDGHAVSHLGWGLNPQGRWDNIALNGDDPERHHAGARSLRATSSSRPDRTRKAAASAPPKATTTCRCATAR